MRPPGYSALMAKRVADDMVDLDRIVEARKVAVADADRYLDDVTEYCKIPFPAIPVRAQRRLVRGDFDTENICC